MAREIRTPTTVSKLTTGSTWMSANLTSAASWNTILTFAAPVGVGYEFTTANWIFADLKDTGGTKITGGDFRLLKANATQSQVMEVFSGPTGIFKDIGDALQRPSLAANITLNSSEVLLGQVYSLGTTLASATSNVYVQGFQVTNPIY